MQSSGVPDDETQRRCPNHCAERRTARLHTILPPLAVGLKAGIGFHLFLNIILTLLVYVPGLLHALWVVLKD